MQFAFVWYQFDYSQLITIAGPRENIIVKYLQDLWMWHVLISFPLWVISWVVTFLGDNERIVAFFLAQKLVLDKYLILYDGHTWRHILFCEATGNNTSCNLELLVLNSKTRSWFTSKLNF